MLGQEFGASPPPPPLFPFYVALYYQLNMYVGNMHYKLLSIIHFYIIYTRIHKYTQNIIYILYTKKNSNYVSMTLAENCDSSFLQNNIYNMHSTDSMYGVKYPQNKPIHRYSYAVVLYCCCCMSIVYSLRHLRQRFSAIVVATGRSELATQFLHEHLHDVRYVYITYT